MESQMRRTTGNIHRSPPSTTVSDSMAANRANDDRSSAQHISLAISSGIRNLDFDSLREVTGSLLEMNQEVVKIILQSKEDVLKNKGLSVLIDDFLENSVLTLDFGSILDACFKRAGHLEYITNVALHKFDEERCDVTTDEEGSVESYSKTLEEFRNFRRVGDPFTEDFFELFNSVVSHQFLFLKRLNEKKEDLDNKCKKWKVLRKVSNVLFVMAFVSVLICTVVEAAVRAPPVVTGLAAAASLPLVLIGRWLNLVLKKQVEDLIGQREIVSSMQVGLYIVAHDLDNLKGLTDKFKVLTGFEDLLGNADFAISTGGEAVTIAVEENKKKMGRFMEEVHSLVANADRCNRDAKMARTVLMRKIINYPNS